MASSVPTNMRMWRDKYGLSLQDVADFLGVSHTLVSYYENGKRDIPLDILVKLAEGLYGIELSTLVNQNAEETEIDAALTFRAIKLSEKDLESIASFKKIVKNYIKLLRLEEKHG